MAEHQTEQTEQERDPLSTRIAHKADKLKYIILGAAAVLAAVVGIVIYTGGARAKQRAADADGVFRSFVALQGKAPADAAPELVAVAKKFAGQPAGIQPAIHAFGAAMDGKLFAEAEAVAQDFIKNYPESPLVPQFTVSLAQARLQQGKTQAAIDGLRAFVGTATPETLPEAKLALAQALEAFANEAADNPEEYARRLDAAQIEYTDITSRARLASPTQRGFWPQVVTLTADYALVQIKDRLAGHVLGVPVGATPAQNANLDAAITPTELEAVQSLRPPGAAEPAETPAPPAGAEPAAETAPAAEAETAPAAEAESAPAE